MTRPYTRLVSLLTLIVIGFGCGAAPSAVAEQHAALENVPLIISEVAQSTSYGGTTADKVEVYCTASGGCTGYKVCDTISGGSSCSALQSALGSSNAR